MTREPFTGIIPILVFLNMMMLLCSPAMAADFISHRDDSAGSSEPYILSSGYPGYKQVISRDSTFAFRIPQKWDVIDNGAVTEGYFLLPPDSNQNVIISINKSRTIGSSNEFAQMLMDRYEEVNQLSFYQGGGMGYVMRNPEDALFLRIENGIQLMLQVEAPRKWRRKYTGEIRHIARSMYPIEAGY